jgi:hypothetical protein
MAAMTGNGSGSDDNALPLDVEAAHCVGHVPPQSTPSSPSLCKPSPHLVSDAARKTHDGMPPPPMTTRLYAPTHSSHAAPP